MHLTPFPHSPPHPSLARADQSHPFLLVTVIVFVVLVLIAGDLISSFAFLSLFYPLRMVTLCSYLVKVLEDGKRRHGVGLHSQVCVLLDRGGTVWKNGYRKVDVLDMNVIPRLVDLFRHLYSTMMDHYPDLLNSAVVAPASWFFSMCYRVTSRVMTAQQRGKFQMINEDEIAEKLHPLLSPALLPEHLGGNSSSYTSIAEIRFDPEASLFPLDRETLRRFQVDFARASEAGVWRG